MDFTLINIINQIIPWFAVIAMELVFIIPVAQKRRLFVPRLMLGNMAGIFYTFTYFPFYRIAKLTPTDQIEAALIYIWWGIFYFLTIGVILWWFDLTKGQAMLRCIMGMCIYAVGNTVMQNFMIGLWFPTLIKENIFLYLALDAGCYVVLGVIGYFGFAKNMGTMKTLYGMDTPLVYGFFSILLVFANIVWDISNGIFQHAIMPITTVEKYAYVVVSVQYFCAFTSVVFSVFVLFLLFLFYRISYIRQEENMLLYLQSEKEKQYEFSRQTIDVINQKCHDLKRQIQALRFSKDSEREKLYQDTQNVADFFNYVVKTENEMLNTILTEKGLLCHSRNIRLTCTVDSCCFNRISVVDLYTIFSNALDNAIECVEKYEEEGKKIISVHISQVGSMNCIMIENYCEEALNYMDGQLITSKHDKNYHGFGVKSIQMLVKKYKGDTRIDYSNHTFCIQIMLPA